LKVFKYFYLEKRNSFFVYSGNFIRSFWSERLSSVSEFLPLEPNPYIAFFQMIGIMLGVSVVGGGIAYAPVGILILAIGQAYRTSGRYAYSIRVAHNHPIIPSGDIIVSQPQKTESYHTLKYQYSNLRYNNANSIQWLLD
jgi:hypothetical protein